MSDPLRTEAPGAADALSGRERDARVEQLLIQGLDHYFAAQYDQAIHVWTRVLFLDRGHARARAYIERARSALAERQRQSEELLHRGVAAFSEGQTGSARQLLNEAVSKGASADVALSYLGRIERLEPFAPVPSRTPPSGRSALPYLPPRSRRGPAAQRPRPFAGALALLAAAALTTVTAAGIVLWMQGVPLTGEPLRPGVIAPDEPLPVPRVAELALTRARRLFAAGRTDEALRTLASIGPADPVQPEADRLRAEIQRALLGAPEPAAAGTPR